MIYKFVIIMFSVSSLFGQEVIEKLQHKFENINTLQATFVQSAAGKSLSGIFSFSKENNYKIELTNNTIISNGKEIYNIDRKRERVIISNLEDDPLSFSLNDYIFRYPNICSVSEEKLDDGYLLHFDASNANLNFKFAKLWINNDYLISKIEVSDFAGNKFVFTFYNMKIDKNFPNDFFSYDNKLNYKVIDLR